MNKLKTLRAKILALARVPAIAALIMVAMPAFSQVYTGSLYRSRVTDSTTVSMPTGYGGFYYNAQAGELRMKDAAGWFNPRSAGTSSLVDGSGTTWNSGASRYDLGGTALADITLNGGSPAKNLLIGSFQHFGVIDIRAGSIVQISDGGFSIRGYNSGIGSGSVALAAGPLGTGGSVAVSTNGDAGMSANASGGKATISSPAGLLELNHDSTTYTPLSDMRGIRYSHSIGSTMDTLSLVYKKYVDSLLSYRQPLDASLTEIAGLGFSNDDLIQQKAGVLTNRTIAQVKTDMGILPNPLTTDYDLYYWLSGAGARLGIGTPGQFLGVNGSNQLAYLTPSVSTALSSITAATGSNTINNGANAQTWQWNTLAGATGLSLTSSSTAAASNANAILGITSTGANSNASQTTYGAFITNQKSGTTSTNIALNLDAQNATTNIALNITNGQFRSASFTSGRSLFVTTSGQVTDSDDYRFSSAAGQLTITRVSADTGPSASIIAQADRTGSMADGFGAAIGFQNEDTDNVENFVGYIAALRNGADNSADFSFAPYTSGSANERFRIAASGTLTASGYTGTGTAFLGVTSTGIFARTALTVDANGGLNLLTSATVNGGINLSNSSVASRGYAFREGTGNISTTADGDSDQGIFDTAALPNNTIIVLQIVIAQIKSDGSEGASITGNATWRKDNSGTLTKVGDTFSASTEDMTGTLSVSTISSSTFIQTRITRTGTSGNFRYGAYIIPIITHSY